MLYVWRVLWFYLSSRSQLRHSCMRENGCISIWGSVCDQGLIYDGVFGSVCVCVISLSVVVCDRLIWCVFEQKNTVQMSTFLLGYRTFIAQKSEWVHFNISLKSHWDHWLLITVFWQIWAQFKTLSNLFWNSAGDTSEITGLFFSGEASEKQENSPFDRRCCLGTIIEVLKRSHLCSNACCRCVCCQLV